MSGEADRLRATIAPAKAQTPGSAGASGTGPTRPRVAIALGGNLGDVAEAFRTAARGLSRHAGELDRVADQFVTRSVGTSAGPEYHNSALTLWSDLPPEPLLTLLQDLEVAAGRRPGGHWQPRPLDLDLIAYGDIVCETPRLTLPHPAAWYRGFVLEPLAQVAGDWVHPHRRQTIHALRARFQRRPLRLGIVAGRRSFLDATHSIAHLPRSLVEWHCLERPEDLRTQPVDLVAWLAEETDPPVPAGAPADRGEVGQAPRESDATILRPASEAGPPDFLQWPAELRLNATSWARADRLWLNHLVSGLLDPPRSQGRWWPGTKVGP